MPKKRIPYLILQFHSFLLTLVKEVRESLSGTGTFKDAAQQYQGLN